MPVIKKDGKWFWGSKGPYETKEQAEAVGRAAYASGYAEESARTVDANGFVTVEGNPITKEGVYEYLGKDIPGYPGNPDDLVKVYRPAEELSKPETLESFKLMPFIDEHEWLGPDGTDPGQLPLSGMTGEQVYWDPPYVKSNIRWFSNDMKSQVENGKKELSPAYSYTPSREPGVFQGEAYTYVMRNLRGNHLALVETGRTGPDVAVMDSAIGEKSMTLEELIAAMKKLDKSGMAAVLAALKAEQEPEEPGEVVDAEKAPEQPNAPPADTDAEPGATDAEPEKVEGAAMDKALAPILKRLNALEKENKELKAKATDSGAIMKALSDRNELANRVATHVGTFAFDSMDTLSVAKYGLEKLELKADSGAEVATLKGYLTALEANPSRTVSFAQDSAPATSGVGTAIDKL